MATKTSGKSYQSISEFESKYGLNEFIFSIQEFGE